MQQKIKQFGLIGKTLSHSFSKQYFTNKFEKEKLSNCQYDNFELAEIDEFRNIIKKQPDIIGLNVTIPYKKAVIPYLHHISDEAKTIGAVNTILNQSGILSGYNTDVIGFKQSLDPLLQTHHKKALILGTGGAAKAVEYVLQQLGTGYTFVSRKPDAKQFSYSQINQAVINEYHIIINTTPLGMHPKLDSYPEIPYQNLTGKHLLYDLVYNPAETVFLKKGKENNVVTKNGIEMLELQAEAAWQIWNNK